MREKSVEEIKSLVRELDGEIFQLRNELKTTRKLEKPHLLKQKKKQRARALCILTEKQTKVSDESK